ncbi:AMP-binding protein [Streptomyces bikiniensis]|uniref:AMP-binding protein n=1 Tax=Streptomyces bikiniensis TaxID=1896 RepID=A0ABW8CU74_STRBI
MTVPPRDLLPAGLRRSWAADGTCPDLDLYGLFRARQIADPHHTAVLDAKGKLCYTALDRKVRCLAVGLRGLGVGPGDVVGVRLPDDRNAVIADLALAALGAVALPFPVDRGVPGTESLLRRSGAVAVIASAEHRDVRHAAGLQNLVRSLPALRHVVAVGPGEVPEGAVAWSELLRSDPEAFVPARPDPDGAARILVSYGSEPDPGSEYGSEPDPGPEYEPRMVAYSHNALAGGRGDSLASLIPDRTPPRCLFLVPLASAFGAGGTPVVLARHGGTLVLLDRFTPGTALAAVREHRPTHVLGTPASIRAMLEHLDPADERLPAATALVLGGAPLDAATATAAAEAFGCPAVRLYDSADGVNCHTGPTRTVPPADGAAVVAGLPDPRVAEFRDTGGDRAEPARLG